MITRRWLLGGASAIAAIAGMYFIGGAYLQSRSAGELAGTFTWGADRNCLPRWFRTRMYLTAKSLEKDEKWWREPFNSAFVAANEKLNAAAAAIGQHKTCALYIDPYRTGINWGSVEFGWWRFPITEEPAAAPEPPRLPTVAESRERLKACQFYRDLMHAGDAYCREAEAQLAEAEARLAPLGPPTVLSGSNGDVQGGQWSGMDRHRSDIRHGILRRLPGSAVAPFKITTSAGSNYFFKLVRRYTNEEEMAGFIVGGRPFEAKVPSGSYELRYAAGDTWISETEFFGPDTAFAKADSPLNFSLDGNRARGVEVQLMLQRGGNLRTSPIKRSEF